MPTGALPLMQAANGTDTLLKQGFVNTIIRESAIAGMIPWITIMSDSIKHREEVSLPNPVWRDVNETYTKSWGQTAEYYWGVTILGGEVEIDNFLLRVMGNKINQKADQFRLWAKAIGLTLDKQIIDGTGTAKDFKGINQIITDGRGQVSYAGANGATLTLDMLDVAYDLMLGQHNPRKMWLNRTLARKIWNLGRSTAVGYPLIDITTNSFGERVTHYAGMEMAIVEHDISGSAILGFDETRGTSAVTSSIYMAAVGDNGVTGLLGAGGAFDVVDFGEQESAPSHLGRVELYPGLAVWDQYSVVRLAGITNT